MSKAQIILNSDNTIINFIKYNTAKKLAKNKIIYDSYKFGDIIIFEIDSFKYCFLIDKTGNLIQLNKNPKTNRWLIPLNITYLITNAVEYFNDLDFDIEISSDNEYIQSQIHDHLNCQIKNWIFMISNEYIFINPRKGIEYAFYKTDFCINSSITKVKDEIRMKRKNVKIYVTVEARGYKFNEYKRKFKTPFWHDNYSFLPDNWQYSKIVTNGGSNYISGKFVISGPSENLFLLLVNIRKFYKSFSLRLTYV